MSDQGLNLVEKKLLDLLKEYDYQGVGFIFVYRGVIQDNNTVILPINYDLVHCGYDEMSEAELGTEMDCVLTEQLAKRLHKIEREALNELYHSNLKFSFQRDAETYLVTQFAGQLQHVGDMAIACAAWLPEGDQTLLLQEMGTCLPQFMEYYKAA